MMYYNLIDIDDDNIGILKRRKLLERTHRKAKVADYSVDSEDIHTQVDQ